MRRAAGRRGTAQGMETAATTGGPETSVEQSQWTWPHHTTFVTASLHEVDLRETCFMDVKAQATVDSDLALWKEWADNDERKEQLPRPLLEPVIMANKRPLRHPHEAPAIRAALGVIKQGVGHKTLRTRQGHRTPVLSEVRAYRETRLLSSDSSDQGETAIGDKLKWERGLMHDPVD